VPRDEATDWASLTTWISEQTEGLSGADLAAMCDNAKNLALRDQQYRHDAVLAGSHLVAAVEASKSTNGNGTGPAQMAVSEIH
jgi:ATP-dependent 26S proteasome regulatory subunit